MPYNYVSQWRYCPSGSALPWKIMFIEPDLLVCENRHRNSGKTFFACLLRGSGKEILRDFSLGRHVQNVAGKDWMTGLETVRGDLFYVHGYEDNSPEHRGIWAVDPLKGEIIWARPEAAFVANLQGGMLVYAAGSFAGFPERNYYLLDAQSGEVLETIGEDALKANSMRRESLSDEELQKVILPEVADHGRLVTGLSDEDFAEYIEHDGLLITVIHSSGKSGEGFDATISAYRNGTKIYQDSLARSAAVPCVNYFLLHNVTLYYIKDMYELISVRF